MLGAGAFNLDGETINEVEEKALKEGYPISKRKGFKKVFVEVKSSRHFLASVEPSLVLKILDDLLCLVWT